MLAVLPSLENFPSHRITRWLTAFALLAICELSLPSAQAQTSTSSRLDRILGTPGNATPASASNPLDASSPSVIPSGDTQALRGAGMTSAGLTSAESNNSLRGSGGEFRSPESLLRSRALLPAAPRSTGPTTGPTSGPRRDSLVAPASFQQPPAADLPPATQPPAQPNATPATTPSLIDALPEAIPADQPEWIEPGAIEDESGPINPLLEPFPDDYPHAGAAHHGPRIMKVNPLAVQQGVANLTLQGDQQIPRETLGFPFSAIPEHWGQRIPRMQIEFDLPDQRHVGRGDPLVGTSWRNRPLHLDAFAGGIFPGDLISGRVEAQNGMLNGVRLGWDVNHYLGAELRLAQAEVGIVDRTSLADIRLYDITLNYYPWGDSRIRPFTSLGLGIGQFTFKDETDLSIDETMMTIPFGVGMKYYLRPNIALRTEFMDTLAFGSQVVDTVNTLSVTAGLEFRFGGTRRNYYPYQTSSRIW